jgi:hypothetical protein
MRTKPRNWKLWKVGLGEGKLEGWRNRDNDTVDFLIMYNVGGGYFPMHYENYSLPYCVTVVIL